MFEKVLRYEIHVFKEHFLFFLVVATEVDSVCLSVQLSCHHASSFFDRFSGEVGAPQIFYQT